MKIDKKIISLILVAAIAVTVILFLQTKPEEQIEIPGVQLSSQQQLLLGEWYEESTEDPSNGTVYNLYAQGPNYWKEILIQDWERLDMWVWDADGTEFTLFNPDLPTSIPTTYSYTLTNSGKTFTFWNDEETHVLQFVEDLELKFMP